MDASDVRDWDEVRSMILESYRLIAPKRTFAKLREPSARSGAPARKVKTRRSLPDPVAALTNESLLHGVGELCKTDADLAGVVDRFGPPPMWARPPGFATMVSIIFEQQVSLASGKATFARLKTLAGRVTPANVADLTPSRLRRSGITRQKADYVLNLARLVVSGEVNLTRIARLDDEKARDALVEIRGIGAWTADVYLLMALKRPDIWPDGDIALAEAARQLKRLRSRPKDDRLRRIAASWKPWRSVAARILWHHYLSVRRPGA